MVARGVHAETHSKDTNSSFVRGVNKICAIVFVKVSPR
jgi:hypothetical protein